MDWNHDGAVSVDEFLGDYFNVPGKSQTWEDPKFNAGDEKGHNSGNLSLCSNLFVKLPLLPIAIPSTSSLFNCNFSI